MGSMHGASRPVALTGSDQVVLATSGAFGGYTLRNTTVHPSGAGIEGSVRVQ
jgi:hypothetical protein